jgi:hypothetical protein
MKKKEIKAIQKELDKYYTHFKMILSNTENEIIERIVGLELELERECNK